jgi:hypothetical protein
VRLRSSKTSLSASLLLCGKLGVRRITVAVESPPSLITYNTIVGKPEGKRSRDECEDKQIFKVTFMLSVLLTYMSLQYRTDETVHRHLWVRSLIDKTLGPK